MFLSCLETVVVQELTFPQRPPILVPVRPNALSNSMRSIHYIPLFLFFFVYSFMQCILFLNSVLSRVSCVELLLKCVPLLMGRLLSCLLLCEVNLESSTLQKETLKCLQTLLVICRNHQDKYPS